ncbi:MAG: hypothetical protein WCO68_00345 [Verrucomicrobiota bacterium]
MLSRLLLLLSLTVFTARLFAADPTPLPAPATEPTALNNRAPSLSITEALQIAQQYMAEKKLDISAHFVSGARYFDGASKAAASTGKGPYWIITYERKEQVQGGQYFVHVFMNREVGHVGGL